MVDDQCSYHLSGDYQAECHCDSQPWDKRNGGGDKKSSEQAADPGLPADASPVEAIDAARRQYFRLITTQWKPKPDPAAVPKPDPGSLARPVEAPPEKPREIDRSPIAIKESPEKITLSATALDPDISVEESIDRADRALLQAKTTGRNRVVTWDPGISTGTILAWRHDGTPEPGA